jgi:glycerol-3-phosphate dehydrogenase (NAD(P)+)
MKVERIAVVGAGAWGAALANVLALAGRKVTLCARDAAAVRRIAERRESMRLPGVTIDASIKVDCAPPGTKQDTVLLAVPAQNLREAAQALAWNLDRSTPVIACAKGIERGTHKFMTDVIAECAPKAVPAILSGPSFARDVATGLPTALTLAAADANLAAGLARALGSPAFRLYHSTDVRGVEIGGAAKNVLAIAAGIVAGRALGASAQAALITRGFAELFRFGEALGARPQTLSGLSGLGDLILTCSSSQSRNFSLGVAWGKGAPPDPATAPLAEGFFTAPALIEMAKVAGVEMPIASAVDDILARRAGIDEAIQALLMRPFRAEA